MSQVELSRHIHFERSLMHFRSKLQRPPKNYIKVARKLQGLLKSIDRRIDNAINPVERFLNKEIKTFND